MSTPKFRIPHNPENLFKPLPAGYRYLWVDEVEGHDLRQAPGMMFYWHGWTEIALADPDNGKHLNAGWTWLVPVDSVPEVSDAETIAKLRSDLKEAQEQINKLQRDQCEDSGGFTPWGAPILR